MLNGIINVYKEAGFTSHDVVAKMRGICGQKKIGHTGTLDPAATGVLPVCLGSGTRLCDMLTEKDKEYVAVLLLGMTTDTQDTTGTVLSRKEVNASEEEVAEAVTSFVGDYDQVPPMYSALKVNGKKLYELARAGKEVEREARRVRIEEIEILHMELPRVTMRVVCSKGTYIRTLCADIGNKLCCGGTMESLQRTRVGIFKLEEALTLSRKEGRWNPAFLRKAGGCLLRAFASPSCMPAVSEAFGQWQSSFCGPDAGAHPYRGGGAGESVCCRRQILWHLCKGRGQEQTIQACENVPHAVREEKGDKRQWRS